MIKTTGKTIDVVNGIGNWYKRTTAMNVNALNTNQIFNKKIDQNENARLVITIFINRT